MNRTLARLQDFGTRSLITHAIMGVTFLGAIVSGFAIGGQIGLVSFVAFVNFTAGMWVCQTIHSIGNATTDDDYEGVFKAFTDHVR